MKLLELFSSTGNVEKVARSPGWEVISIDLKNAEINADIQTWDYRQFEPKSFNVLILWGLPHHAQNTA